MTVWLVDDDFTTRFISEQWMKQLPLITSYKLFDSASVVVQELKQVKPDCILLDLSMPVMNGWEFLEILEQNQEIRVPIVICSSSSTSKDTDLVERYAFVKGYIEKPINLIKLNKAIGFL